MAGLSLASAMPAFAQEAEAQQTEVVTLDREELNNYELPAQVEDQPSGQDSVLIVTTPTQENEGEAYRIPEQFRDQRGSDAPSSHNVGFNDRASKSPSGGLGFGVSRPLGGSEPRRIRAGVMLDGENIDRQVGEVKQTVSAMFTPQ